MMPPWYRFVKMGRGCVPTSQTFWNSKYLQMNRSDDRIEHATSSHFESYLLYYFWTSYLITFSLYPLICGWKLSCPNLSPPPVPWGWWWTGKMCRWSSAPWNHRGPFACSQVRQLWTGGRDQWRPHRWSKTWSPHRRRTRPQCGPEGVPICQPVLLCNRHGWDSLSSAICIKIENVTKKKDS